MDPQTFSLTEIDLESGAREIHVVGELDLAVADRLSDAIERGDGGDLLICLEACEFIDSTGLAVLLRAHQAAQKDGGGRVLIHSPSRPVLRILEVTGLTGNGFVFESREAAAAASDSDD
jgi:anti-anti-sigma factor